MSGRQGKNDAADAQAIGEAMQCPNMRFVPVKTKDQQSRLAGRHARQGFVEARTATVDRIRCLLSEFGIVLPLKAHIVRAEARTTLRPGGFARLCVLGAKAVLSNFIDESLCNSS